MGRNHLPVDNVAYHGRVCVSIEVFIPETIRIFRAISLCEFVVEIKSMVEG